MRDFGSRLRTLREAKGWSAYRLGLLSGLTNQAVLKLERTTDPKLSTLEKLAGAFGVPVSEFLRMLEQTEAKGRKRPGKV
jgi:transcriptional regulator with XRE-family HTH domain